MPGFEIFGDEERKEVNDVLESGILMRYGFDGARNGHWKAKELEQAIEDKFNVKHAQLTSSGTTALNVAMAVLGVGAGDEVIMPSFTFVATFEVILAMGATPIVVDVDDTLALDPKAVEAAITPRTKAVMVVHMCGAMADLDPLKEVCDKHNVKLVEDACQAIGGTYKGVPLGAYGEAGAFSFDFVKTITAGEGGAVITNNDEYGKHADHFSDHGHDHVGNDRGAESHPFIGYNFRISELHAAVGLAQIRKLDKIIEIQRRNKKIIKDALATIPEVSFRRIPDEAGDSATFLSFFMPTAELATKVGEAFKAHGVDAYWNYYDNNWHYIRRWEHFKGLQSLYPISKEIKETLQDFSKIEFKQSDDYISRNTSCLIKLSWSEEDAKQRAEQMVAAIKSVL